MATIGYLPSYLYSTPHGTAQPPGQPPDGQPNGGDQELTADDALMQMTNSLVFSQFSEMEEQRMEDDGE